MEKKMIDIPKVYLIGNGNDGSQILDYLKSLGGKNIYYGADYTKTYRWKAKDINEGDYCWIDSRGEICITIFNPTPEYKITF